MNTSACTLQADTFRVACSHRRRCCVAGDGQGLGFHTHAHTWLGLIAGVKAWLLFEPGAFPRGNLSYPNRMLGAERLLSQWAADGGGEEGGGRPMLCFQHPGEILYLPTGWAHAPLTLGETVGIGGQTQTCSGAEACTALIEQLEASLSLGGKARAEAELYRLLSHAHLMLGQDQSRHRMRELFQVMYHIETVSRTIVAGIWVAFFSAIIVRTGLSPRADDDGGGCRRAEHFRGREGCSEPGAKG